MLLIDHADLQEAAPAAATVKEDDEDASGKGSESDEGEANKDSPSERDDDSDKQSDTEVDEMAGDDEEVRESGPCSPHPGIGTQNFLNC